MPLTAVADASMQASLDIAGICGIINQARATRVSAASTGGEPGRVTNLPDADSLPGLNGTTFAAHSRASTFAIRIAGISRSATRRKTITT